MSTHAELMSGERASFDGFVDIAGGLATIVLAIAGLAGVQSVTMLGIVTIIFGAALLIQGGTMMSEYAHVLFPAEAASVSVDQFGGGTLSAIFMVGATGMVLGVLALLSVHATTLTAIAVIAFGAGLVLSSNSVMNLELLKSAAQSPAEEPRSGNEIVATQMASSTAGIQAIAGLAAVVLGILAVVGINSTMLSLVALLVLGATLIMTGTAMSTVMMGFMRPAPQSRTGA